MKHNDVGTDPTKNTPYLIVSIPATAFEPGYHIQLPLQRQAALETLQNALKTYFKGSVSEKMKLAKESPRPKPNPTEDLVRKKK